MAPADRRHADRRRRHGNTGVASISISTLGSAHTALPPSISPTGNFGGSTSSPLAETIISSLSTPIISEFLASNQGELLDAAGDSSDWIEVYNPTSTAIDLYDYSLTDDASDLTKWQFPHVTLARTGFLIVFADSRRYYDGNRVAHQFQPRCQRRISGCWSIPTATVVSQYPQYPQQVGDVSYGVDFNRRRSSPPGPAPRP